jgi:hypothetical protein
MNRHRTRLLTITAAIATVSALVLVAALIVVPAVATPQTLIQAVRDTPRR